MAGLEAGHSSNTPGWSARFGTGCNRENVGDGAHDVPAVPGRNRIYLWAKTQKPMDFHIRRVGACPHRCRASNPGRLTPKDPLFRSSNEPLPPITMRWGQAPTLQTHCRRFSKTVGGGAYDAPHFAFFAYAPKDRKSSDPVPPERHTGRSLRSVPKPAPNQPTMCCWLDCGASWAPPPTFAPHCNR